MGSLPMLSSSDGVQVVAALLGHTRHTPTSCCNVRILDSIFDEIVDSLRLSFPLRHELDVGAAAVSSVLNALHDISVPVPNPISPSTRSSHDHLPTLHSLPHSVLPTSAPLQLPPVYAPAPPLPPLPPPQSAIAPTQLPRHNPGNPSQSTQLDHHLSAQRRPRRPPRKKRYHDAVPSTHCHVCCRPSTAVPMAVCSNIKEGTCRKVVCNRCIVENGWDWQHAVAENSSWICPHCTDSCTKVPRAQCWVYMRTNSRRRENRNKRLRTSASDGASDGGAKGVLAAAGSGRQGALADVRRQQHQRDPAQSYRQQQDQNHDPHNQTPPPTKLQQQLHQQPPPQQQQQQQQQQPLQHQRQQQPPQHQQHQQPPQYQQHQQPPQHQQHQQSSQLQQHHQIVEPQNLDSHMTRGERVAQTVVGTTTPECYPTVSPKYSGFSARGIVRSPALALTNSNGNVNGVGKLVRDGNC